MSQLLCEQVVGRGLRRRSYDLTEDGKFEEEVAKILGVPFEVVPFKQRTGPLEEIKVQAARRWVAAGNADGSYGEWRSVLIKTMGTVTAALDEAAATGRMSA